MGSCERLVNRKDAVHYARCGALHKIIAWLQFGKTFVFSKMDYFNSTRIFFASSAYLAETLRASARVSACLAGGRRLS